MSCGCSDAPVAIHRRALPLLCLGWVMLSLRSTLSSILGLTLLFWTAPTIANTNPPLGISTLAFDGSLDFSYRDESRKLLEGQTYRIYLDSSADAQGNSGGSVHKVDHQQKVTADIVLGRGAGLLGWSILNLMQAESPSNPTKNK